MKQIQVLLAVLACFWSCRQAVEIQYENMPDVGTVFVSDDRILNDTFMFGGPMDIFLVDSLIVVSDFQSHEYAFHVFDKSGTHLCDFGRRGRGPGELVSVSSAKVSDGRIVAYDAGLKKIIVYDLMDVMSGERTYGQEYSLVGKTDNTVFQTIPAAGDFILAGNNDKMRFGVWNPGRSIPECTYTGYPPFVSDDEVNWSIANYAVSMEYSPDNAKLVTGTYIGCTLEMFDVDETEIRRDTVRYFYDFKEVGYAKGAVPKWVVPDGKTVIGFQDIVLTPDMVYGLIWGIESDDMEKGHQKIIGFDYAGQPVCAYTLDDILVSFDIDDTGHIYGIAVTSDFSDYCIKVYPIDM